MAMNSVETLILRMITKNARRTLILLKKKYNQRGISFSIETNSTIITPCMPIKKAQLE